MAYMCSRKISIYCPKKSILVIKEIQISDKKNKISAEKNTNQVSEICSKRVNFSDAKGLNISFIRH